MNTYDLSEEQINRILTTYKNKRERENKYYHEVSKNNEEFRNKNRQRAKNHYHKVGKLQKKEKYDNNKDLIKAKTLYNYYKKKDNIIKYEEKYPEKIILLKENNFI